MPPIPAAALTYAVVGDAKSASKLKTIVAIGFRPPLARSMRWISWFELSPRSAKLSVGSTRRKLPKTKPGNVASVEVVAPVASWRVSDVPSKARKSPLESVATRFWPG
ncbi:MAG: hypothetical protein R3F34_10020 [Planctomycetota bacterium]